MRRLVRNKKTREVKWRNCYLLSNWHAAAQEKVKSHNPQASVGGVLACSLGHELKVDKQLKS